MDEQKIQDLLTALQAQREQALNALAMAQAEITRLNRELKAKEDITE